LFPGKVVSAACRRNLGTLPILTDQDPSGLTINLTIRFDHQFDHQFGHQFDHQFGINLTII
jgi:hypothetical protein